MSVQAAPNWLGLLNYTMVISSYVSPHFFLHLVEVLGSATSILGLSTFVVLTLA